MFVHSVFNLIWHGFCTKSSSAILLLGQEAAIRTTKFCRQILPYLYEQNLIICQNPEMFGILFSKYSKSLCNFYTKLGVAISNPVETGQHKKAGIKQTSAILFCLPPFLFLKQLKCLICIVKFGYNFSYKLHCEALQRLLKLE